MRRHHSWFFDMVTLCLMPYVKVGELDPMREPSESEGYKKIPGRH